MVFMRFDMLLPRILLNTMLPQISPVCDRRKTDDPKYIFDTCFNWFSNRQLAFVN